METKLFVVQKSKMSGSSQRKKVVPKSKQAAKHGAQEVPMDELKNIMLYGQMEEGEVST